MFSRKTGIGSALAAFVATMTCWAGAALALPYDYELGFQPAASPVMSQIITPAASSRASSALSRIVGRPL